MGVGISWVKQRYPIKDFGNDESNFSLFGGMGGSPMQTGRLPVSPKNLARE